MNTGLPNTTIKPLIGGLAVVSESELLHAEGAIAIPRPPAAGPRGTVLLAGVAELVDRAGLGSGRKSWGFESSAAPFRT